jgi:hypothetical protein
MGIPYTIMSDLWTSLIIELLLAIVRRTYASAKLVLCALTHYALPAAGFWV